MNAVLCRAYGSSDGLEIAELPCPVPKSGEVLIKTAATTVTSADWRVRSLKVPRGYGIPARLAFGIFRPRQPILGTELAGWISAVGRDVTRFKEGDPVVAYSGLGFGCHAEYRTMADTWKVFPKPETLSFEQAAALCFGGSTALVFLRSKGQIKSGQRVLVIGASGALGTAAVQLARHYGAWVTGVCSTSNLELVAALGAAHTVDYTRQDIAALGETYDIVFDTVGALPIGQSLGLVRPGGRLLMAAPDISDDLRIPWVNITSPKTATAGTAKEKAPDLETLAELAADGAFTPVIDRVYALEQIREAHDYVASGHKRGSVVIQMASAGYPSAEKTSVTSSSSVT